MEIIKSSFYINNPNNIIEETLTSKVIKSAQPGLFHSSLPFYRPTPLINLPGLAKKYNAGNIYLKDESKRFGLNAFKALGASFAINEVLKNKPEINTFCTATDGNHGRAVAWAARYFNKKAYVFVPENTSPQRIEAIRKEGAIVQVTDSNYDKTCEYAREMAKKNQWELIQDTAWPGYEEIPAQIMAGYLSLFQEMENSIHTPGKAKIDLVFLQAGVGSFAGTGISYYLERYGKKRPKIVIVEPREADAILYSMQEGKISTSRGNSNTIMAGLNCGTPSLGAWSLLKNGSDVFIKINDSYSKRAIRELYFPKGNDEKIISGESGAAGLAGFLAIMDETELKPLQQNLNLNSETNILFISTEGATDFEMFNSIVSQG